MASGSSSSGTVDGTVFSTSVKQIRTARGLSTRQTATAMNMSLRSYQRFEAGTMRLNLDHIHRFARATSSDPYALVIGVMISSSHFARNTADNMLGTILVVGLQNLEQAAGDRISELDTRTLIRSVATMFEELAANALGRDPAGEWLKKGEAELLSKRPRPGR